MPQLSTPGSRPPKGPDGPTITLIGRPDEFGPFKGPLVNFDPNADPNSVSATFTETVMDRIEQILWVNDQVVGAIGVVSLHQTVEPEPGPFSSN